MDLIYGALKSSNGDIFPLNKSEFLIGRADDNDLVIKVSKYFIRTHQFQNCMLKLFIIKIKLNSLTVNQ